MLSKAKSLNWNKGHRGAEPCKTCRAGKWVLGIEVGGFCAVAKIEGERIGG